MSIDATRWAWKQTNLRPMQKLVLLSLADRAGADDCCYPSKAMLVQDTGIDPKTVWSALKELSEMGLISDTGRRVGHTKQIPVWHLVGVESRHGKDSETGRVPDLEGFHFSHESIPKTERKAFQKRNTEPTNEPINNHKKKSTTFSESEMPEIDPSLANEFIAYRKAKKSPLTPTAWKGIQREAEKAGWTVTAAVEETITRGWQSFKADWVAQKVASPSGPRKRHVVNPVRAA